MSRDTAKGFYDKNPGDPESGYVTPADAQAALDVVYDDMQADVGGADAINAKLGTAPQGSNSTVQERLEQIEAGANLAAQSVTSDKIANGAIVDADINAGAAIAPGKIAGTSVTRSDTGTVTSAMIENETIFDSDINPSANIDPAKIAGNPIPRTLIDAKGDLLVGTGNDAVDRLAVGADNTMLVADSTQPSGVKWAAGGGAAGVFDVTSYGAVGDGTTDDSVAIRAALAAASPGDTVVFPNGTYVASKDGSNAWCFTVPEGLTIAGPGTVKLADSSAEWARVFHVATDNVTFDGLGIDGNKANNSTQEHRHGIMVDGVTGFTARNCRIVDCTGDGILLGTSTRCEVIGNYMTGHERNAVTLYADVVSTSTSHVRIVDNYLNCAVQPVDSEPENSATVDDVVVSGNELISDADYGIALVGGARWTVTGNNIAGGVYVIDVDQATVSGNSIDGTVNAYAESSAVVDVWGQVTNLALSNNTITTTKSGQKGIAVVTVTTVNDQVTISGNTIVTADADGIECRAKASVIASNTITLTTATAWTNGIYIFATNAIDSAIVIGNTIREFDIGVSIDAYQANDVSRAIAIGNVIEGTAGKRDGLRFNGGTGGTHLLMCVVSDNLVQSTYGTAVNEVDGAGTALKRGFYGTTPIAKPTVTGSRGSNAALASLCTALANLGLITNSTS